MQTILMDVLCLDCHSDQFLKEGANIEAAVESMIALILLDFLGGEIVIEHIRVSCSLATLTQPSQHWLQMYATSANTACAIPVNALEVRLEEAICCALLEHFHIVVINRIDANFHEV
ncbi:MAG TPA: hypothetical protein VGD98_13995 [Ktedonobacteraceae bacterium]